MSEPKLTYTPDEVRTAARLYLELKDYNIEGGTRQVIPQSPTHNPPPPTVALGLHPIFHHPARAQIHALVIGKDWPKLSKQQKIEANLEIDSPFTVTDLEAYRLEWLTRQKGSKSDWSKQANSDGDPGGYVGVASYITLLGVRLTTYRLGQLIHACPIPGGTLLLTRLTPAASKGRVPDDLLTPKGELERQIKHLETWVDALLWLADRVTVMSYPAPTASRALAPTARNGGNGE